MVQGLEVRITTLGEATIDNCRDYVPKLFEAAGGGSKSRRGEVSRCLKFRGVCIDFFGTPSWWWCLLP